MSGQGNFTIGTTDQEEPAIRQRQTGFDELGTAAANIPAEILLMLQIVIEPGQPKLMAP